MAQKKYIREIILRFLGSCNIVHVTTPADPSDNLTKEMCSTANAKIVAILKIPYREAVGCLLW